MGDGLRIERRFTKAGDDPFGAVEWGKRNSKIANPDGSVVFEMKDAEIPTSWSQVAADIMVSKYFRKAGVPQVDDEGNEILDEDGNPVTGPERSAKQVIGRLASTWRWWGERHGYFASDEDAQAFEDELVHMLVTQMAAPNSPQWFNTGLNHAYGLTGPAQGFWYVDPETEELLPSPDSYSRPAPHACFPAGTRIATDGGWLPIEKVEPGERVLTHTGRYQPVVDVMQRQVDEPLVRIAVTKLRAHDLVATENHPVLALRRDDVRAARRERRLETLQAEWIPAGSVERGDYVVVLGESPDERLPETVDLAEELGPNFEVDDVEITTRNSAHRPTLNRFVEFSDPALMRLIGRWLGDGSIGHETRDGAEASVNFVFDASDEEGMEDVARLMATHFGVETPAEFAKGQATAHLRYTRRPLARWFADTFGEGFAGKSLPEWAFQLPHPHKTQLLVGLFQADGCVGRHSDGYTALNFDHSNRDLAEGVWRLARSLGYGPSLHGGRVKPGGTVPHYRVHISAKDAPELAIACGVDAADTQSTRSSRREIRFGGLTAFPVAEVTREPFFGTVYNLQVEEDESYVAELVAVHNCFIQAVDDDLVNEGGIMDLWTREARLFKFGAGTGSNFSKIRAENEPLTGGGKSSGVMSFLKIGDRAAGAIKSGGTTRRAAKMVILDIDHPDIEEFVDWKKVEEEKVRALIAAGYPSDFNGEAYQTVSGQNSNNSVRVTEEFLKAVENDEDWELTARTDGSVMKTVKARDLWRRIAEAAWACADPGVQYDTTINQWHTSPAGGRINASNPCSEYLFLDNTACNLASLNLVRFYDDESQTFDVETYKHAIRLWTVVLEISVAMAHFPSKEIAQGSYDYRTLGLGYANLGSLLMRSGIPYDSDEGRAITGALTAILTGDAYATSAEMASVLGPFPRFEENRDSMLRVMRNHRRAAHGEPDGAYEGVTHHVMAIDHELCPPELVQAARESWDTAVAMGEEHGYRNAQASVLAPTGTIGLLLDCDTTGVEPDFSLVKFKKLAGGGYFKIANQSIDPALRALGYDESQRNEIVRYVVGSMSLEGSPHVNAETLREKGFTDEDIANIEATLPGVFELKHAFNVFVVGEEAMQRLGFDEDTYTSFDFDMLRSLGFTKEQIEEANAYICGMQTIEGAHHLADEHLPVFDTANKNGKHGERYIDITGHIKAMAAAQPFLSGSISKTANLPSHATVDDIEEAYAMSAELGLKAIALYRDGSKASQPLSSSSGEGDTNDDEDEAVAEALESEHRVVTGTFAPGVSPTQAYHGVTRPRFLLPSRRTGWTQEARIGGHKVFLRTGEYADGTLGELFIDLAKEGATLRGILSCFAIAVSKGLQYGVPLEEFVDTFTFQTFEPRGMVEGHPNIKMANSIIDYVFRAVGMEYLGRDDLVQVKPSDHDLPEPPKGLAVDAGVQLGLDEDLPQNAPISHPAVAEPEKKPSPNGIGNGHQVVEKIEVQVGARSGDTQTASVQQALGEMMGDAPLCDTCGHITVRNGSCYRCLNCGNSMGCS